MNKGPSCPRRLHHYIDCTADECPHFIERVLPAAGEALHCLLYACGVYARGWHRALAYREAGVWLLAR